MNHTATPNRSPQGLSLPIRQSDIEAAGAMYRDNKGTQWSRLFAIGLQVAGNKDLRNDLATLLYELDIPTSSIADAFNLTGRELHSLWCREPIARFTCTCGKPLNVRDRRDHRRLVQAVYSISRAREGDISLPDLLCGDCIERRLQEHNDTCRSNRLASQARIAQLRKMPFVEYRLTPEWQARRTAALSRAGYRCQACAARDRRLDVHHNTYERYGDESLDDLIVFCERCHQRIHGFTLDAS